MDAHNSTPTLEECGLLGLAMLVAQRVEFLLYGIASHLAHTPPGQKERRWRDLTPEKFLRGDPDELKATLGQLVEAFGEELLIQSPELVAFYRDRNRIAHDYTRLYKVKIRDVVAPGDGPTFLREFIERATLWEKVLHGALAELKMAAAKKEGREAEIRFTERDLEHIKIYRDQAHVYVLRKVAAGEVVLPDPAMSAPAVDSDTAV